MELILLSISFGAALHRGGLAVGDAFGAFGDEDDLQGVEDDLEVELDGAFCDVDEVKLQLVFGDGVVFAVDLGVAGEAGFYLEAKAVFRKLAEVLLHDFRALGAWTDDRHVTLQNIDELREFIDADFSDDAADLRDSVVVHRRELRTALLCVDAHRAELDDVEGAAIFGEPLLTIKHGAVIFEADCCRSHKEDRRQHDEAEAGDHDVAHSFHNRVIPHNRRLRVPAERRVEGVGDFIVEEEQVIELHRRVNVDVMRAAVEDGANFDCSRYFIEVYVLDGSSADRLFHRREVGTVREAPHDIIPPFFVIHLRFKPDVVIGAE